MDPLQVNDYVVCVMCFANCSRSLICNHFAYLLAFIENWKLNFVGYLIFWTNDKSKPDRAWTVQHAMGDKLSTIIDDIVPDTMYYFKIQARNDKGYGPMSGVVPHRSLKSSLRPPGLHCI